MDAPIGSTHARLVTRLEHYAGIPFSCELVGKLFEKTVKTRMEGELCRVLSVHVGVVPFRLKLLKIASYYLFERRHLPTLSRNNR